MFCSTVQVPKFVLVSSLAVTRPWTPIALLLNTAFGLVLQWKLKVNFNLMFEKMSSFFPNIIRLICDGL